MRNPLKTYYVCKVCGKEYVRRAWAVEHALKKHPEENKPR